MKKQDVDPNRAVLNRAIALLASLLLAISSGVALADEPILSAKENLWEVEENALDAPPRLATLSTKPGRVARARLEVDIRSFLESRRDVFKMETSKSSFHCGEDINFKLCFSENIEAEKQMEIMEKLRQCGARFRIGLLSNGEEIAYREPISETGMVPRYWALFSEDGLPNYFRLRSRYAVELISPNFANTRRTRNSDKKLPLKFQIKATLFDGASRVVEVLSQELTVEPPNTELEEVATELAKQRATFGRLLVDLRLFRFHLLDANEDNALKRLKALEERLKNENEYVRAYFLQRVVRTLHKFMGIDKCPELQKKRAQYEEELGLRWIQY